jgi:UDP-N-acetylglucosamine 2-epimerase
VALADQYKSGRQSTPQDRLDNNMVENIKSSLEQSKARADLSKQAQDYMDQQAGKKVVNRGN